MSAVVQSAIDHWGYVAPLLKMPVNEAEYNALVKRLDDVLIRGGHDETHPLAELASRMGDVIEAYDEAHRPMPEVPGVEALRYLMEEHGLAQGAIREIGPQSVVSEILGGRRKLNLRQVAALAKRFSLPAAVFIDSEQRETGIDLVLRGHHSKKAVKQRKKVMRRRSRHPLLNLKPA